MNNTNIQKKCVIFGCGGIGKAAYEKLHCYYNIVAYSDNNSNLWGEKINGVPVISPKELMSVLYGKDADIYVCMEDYKDVVVQLQSLGMEGVRVWIKGFFYTTDGLFPKEFPVTRYKKQNQSGLSILFVSNSANIRDHKMAKMAKRRGSTVHLAYITKDPIEENQQYNSLYENVFPAMSMGGLRTFIDMNDFDIIHSSSEPDFLTPILMKCGKPVVLDCHDLRSSNRPVTPDLLMLEYVAHTEADGIIYPTQGLREETIKKYNSDPGKSFVIENYVSRELAYPERLQKLSDKDGGLHLVYEGGLAFDDPTYKYYHKDLWLRLAEEGMHVHFYTPANREKCLELDGLHDNIHYEGNLSSLELSGELSKYDVGLCMYNLTTQSRHYINNASCNKLYEYLNAGLPVAVNDIDSLSRFVEKNGVGKTVDCDDALRIQMETIAEIGIDDGFLENNKLYFEDQEETLIELYQMVLGRNQYAR